MSRDIPRTGGVVSVPDYSNDYQAWVDRIDHDGDLATLPPDAYRVFRHLASCAGHWGADYYAYDVERISIYTGIPTDRVHRAMCGLFAYHYLYLYEVQGTQNGEPTCHIRVKLLHPTCSPGSVADFEAEAAKELVGPPVYSTETVARIVLENRLQRAWADLPTS